VDATYTRRLPVAGKGMSDRGKYVPIQKFPHLVCSMTSAGRPSKKRAAPSQIGPKSKRVHSEKPRKKDEKPDAVKRSKPVTLLRTQDSDISSDGEGEGSSEEENAELADDGEEKLDVQVKDPNGECRI
jgi:hypothetical protein